MANPSLAALSVALMAAPALAQHVQVSAVATNPTNPTEVWTTNRGNNSVSVVDASTGTLLTEIGVGVWPRTLSFTADGATVFVANQRGDIPLTDSFIKPFDGTEIRDSVSVIDTATKTVMATITGVGTEPFGVAVAPNDAYFAVSGFRSGTVKFYRTSAPYDLLLTHQYPHDLSHLTGGDTVLTADSDSDFIADVGEPRAFTITSDSSRLWVSHNISPFISVLDLTLDGNGEPTSVVMTAKFSTNEYALHPVFNPVPVQVLKSQGLPRFQDDIALSPDGTRALVPGLLHNLNHDVNHNFGPGLAGDFANRVYPTLTVVDAVNLSYGQGGDTSNRLHHELSDTLTPAEHVSYGDQGYRTASGVITLGANGAPIPGNSVTYRAEGTVSGDTTVILVGTSAIDISVPGMGSLYTFPVFCFFPPGPTQVVNLPNDPNLNGKSIFFQAAVISGSDGTTALSNGIETVFGSEGTGLNKMGYRAGHPSKVQFSPSGSHALLMNRGSEDLFLYEINGSDMELVDVFPPRHGFQARAALDTTTPMGDLPMGFAIAPDASTLNNDALVYVMNESTSTLSSLRVDWDAGVITQEQSQVSTLTGADFHTLSERIGQELFEDASRDQTAGNFNNSCASCHFEGGADGNVWQRPAGPRSTMPVYGGTLLTGTILWKGVRINMAETGPMFGGENGGHGLLTDAEQFGLNDYHEVIPVPLNPNLDANSQYSANAALGRDLFFGLNDTGLNPSLRHAGCAGCHPDNDGFGVKMGYTTDTLDPALTSTLDFGMPGGLYEFCFQLQENILGENMRNVNSGANVDFDGDGFPDSDRNNDGWVDIETYTPMNVDTDDGFFRDDPSSWDCLQDPSDLSSPSKFFSRDMRKFVVPTKLGVFSSGPYFHDHAVSSLRNLVNPQEQQTDPVYGDASYPGLQKLWNGEHDIRGEETFLPGASKVQLSLLTVASGSTFLADISAVLDYISSL